MIMQINNLGVSIVIDTIQEKIFVTEDNTNSKKLFNMVVKAILHNCNIDINDYKIINKIK